MTRDQQPIPAIQPSVPAAAQRTGESGVSIPAADPLQLVPSRHDMDPAEDKQLAAVKSLEAPAPFRLLAAAPAQRQASEASQTSQESRDAHKNKPFQLQAEHSLQEHPPSPGKITFQLMENDTPPRPDIAAWPALQAGPAVVQRIPLKITARTGGRRSKITYIDSRTLYTYFKEYGPGFLLFNRQYYPSTQKVLNEARFIAHSQGKKEEQKEIEEMLISVYGESQESIDEFNVILDQRREKQDDYMIELLLSLKHTKRKREDDDDDERVVKKRKLLRDQTETDEESELEQPPPRTRKEVKTGRPGAPGTLGLVTWNVAHFSEKDLDEGEKQDEDEKQDGEEQELREEITDRRFKGRLMSIVRRFSYVESQWEAFSKMVMILLTRIDEKIDKDHYWSSVKDWEECRMRFKVALANAKDKMAVSTDIFENLHNFINLDWEAAYDHAMDSFEAKALLSKQVKEFRDFGRVYVAELVTTFDAITRLWNPELKSAGFLAAVDKKVNILGLIKTQKEILRGQLNKTEIEEITRALHTRNIALQSEDMFRNNDWLDIIILQEVNNPSMLYQEDSSYTIETGPQMLSGGKNPQREYYPLLIREGSGITLSKVFKVNTEGEMKRSDKVNEETGERTYKDIKWNKKKDPPTYRPIIVYEIKRPIPSDQQEDEDMGQEPEQETIWVGVVHTTPETDSGIAEYNRSKIYGEIKKGLKTLSEKAASLKIPLIIGGDYYLSAEAVVDKVYNHRHRDNRHITEVRAGTDQRYRQLTRESELFMQLKKALEDVIHYDAEIEEQKSKLEGKTNTSKKIAERGIALKDEKRKNILEEFEVDSTAALQAYYDEQALLEVERGKAIKVLDETRSPVQILRNIKRLTTKKQLKDLKLTLTQPVSGTNPKESPLTSWYKLQIADFFAGRNWDTSRAGIMRPQGQMVTTDAEDLRHSRYWQHFSDHFPVGGVFSTDKADPRQVAEKLNQAFVQDEKAIATAAQLNIDRFSFQYVKDRLLQLRKPENDEAREEISEEMTRKAYLHRIGVLMHQYPKAMDELPKEEANKQELLQYFNRLRDAIKSSDSNIKEVPAPGYDDYIAVYLTELQEDPDMPKDLDQFRNQREELAIAFLKQRLMELREKAKKMPVDEMDTQQDPQPNNLELLNGFINKIQQLEQLLIDSKKMKKRNAMVAILPVDIEPEGKDKAPEPMDEQQPEKKKEQEAEPPITEEEQFLELERFYGALNSAELLNYLVSQQQGKTLNMLFRTQGERMAEMLENHYMQALHERREGVFEQMELLQQYSRFSVSDMLGKAARIVTRDGGLFIEMCWGMAHGGFNKYLKTFLVAALGHLHGKDVYMFVKMLAEVARGGVQIDAGVIRALLNKAIQEGGQELQFDICKMLIECKLANEKELYQLLHPPVFEQPKKSSPFSGTFLDDDELLLQGIAASLQEEMIGESFTMASNEGGLDTYLTLYNAPGRKENCLIYSLARAMGITLEDKQAEVVGKTIRELTRQQDGEYLDTGTIPNILSVLSSITTVPDARVVVIDTQKKVTDPEQKGRPCFAVETFNNYAANIIYIVNAKDLHFGYASLNDGWEPVFPNEVRLCFWTTAQKEKAEKEQAEKYLDTEDFFDNDEMLMLDDSEGVVGEEEMDMEKKEGSNDTPIPIEEDSQDM